jgi:hypothetical protein
MAARILIIVSGGLIQGVYTDDPDDEVIVADYDIEEADATKRDRDNSPVNVYLEKIVENVQLVNNFYALAIEDFS